MLYGTRKGENGPQIFLGTERQQLKYRIFASQEEFTLILSLLMSLS